MCSMYVERMAKHLRSTTATEEHLKCILALLVVLSKEINCFKAMRKITKLPATLERLGAKGYSNAKDLNHLIEKGMASTDVLKSTAALTKNIVRGLMDIRQSSSRRLSMLLEK